MMKNTFDSYEQQVVLGHLNRHLVGLTWVDVLADPLPTGALEERSDLKSFLTTGFLVSVRGHWFVATAGHILRDITGRIEGGRRIAKARLLDLAIEGRGQPPIVIDLRPTEFAFVYEEEMGLDYGLIPLNRLTVANLEAGNAAPICEEQVADLEAIENSDAWVLLGLPNSAQDVGFSKTHDGGIVHLDFGAPLLPLYPCESIPDVLMKPHERFHARVPIGTGEYIDESGEVTVDDIDGMSGGPIFALKWIDDHTVSYRLIGIQSGWERQNRVIAACFALPMLMAIARTIDLHAEGIGKAG